MKSLVLKQAFKKYNNFLISTHVNPDPDGLTSELVIANYLQSLGKNVTIVNEESIPERFKFFPGINMMKSSTARFKNDFDAAVVVDCGDFARVGKVSRWIPSGLPIVNIDHHITNDLFGTVNWVIPQASSTAEVIYDLLHDFGFQLTKDIAMLLYVGILTDTGSFRYENTSAHTHQIVGELMRFDFSVSELYTRLYETMPLNDLLNFTQLMSRFEPVWGGKVILLELKKKDQDKFSQDFDLRDKIFRYLRAIKGVHAIVILTEHEKGKTRVNLRSSGKVDVARLAAQFNGGGHKRASGCMVNGSMPAARKKILKALEEVLSEE